MGSTSELKQNNLLDIIKIVRNYGPVTKPEIARLSDLTSATVHNFINELMDKKLIVEDGIARSNGGRKAVLYKINRGYGFIVGQNIGVGYISTKIFDINLKQLYAKKVMCRMDYSEKIINLMCSEIESGIRDIKHKTEDCLGIGISVPGQVNHESGVVINLTNVSYWRGIPVKNIIQDRFGVKTCVDNDNNANAIAAKWLNIIPEKSNAVFISITDGVGTGVVTRGSLFYGTHFNAGELGHTTIRYDGPACNCGNRGCIEVFASDFAVIDKVNKITEGKCGTDAVNNDGIDIKAVIKLAKAGNKSIYDMLKETAGFISIAIDHAIKLYDPEVIVIQSNWLKEFPEIFHDILDNVFIRCSWVRREALRIAVNSVEDIETIGPAALVLENMFEFAEDNEFINKLMI